MRHFSRDIPGQALFFGEPQKRGAPVRHLVPSVVFAMGVVTCLGGCAEVAENLGLLTLIKVRRSTDEFY